MKKTRISKIFSEEKNINIFKMVLYSLLALVIFWLPIPQGTFYENDIYIAQLLISLISLAYIVFKVLSGRKLEFFSPLFIPIILLLLMYVLSLIFSYAINISATIDMIFRYTIYALLFVLFSDLGKDITFTEKALIVFSIIGFVISIISYGPLFGVTLKETGFSMGRLKGIMSYSNASGMYYGVVYLCLLSVYILKNERHIRILTQVAMYLVLTLVLLTVSKGAILLLPIVYIIMFAFLKGRRCSMVCGAAPSIVIALILYYFYYVASPILNPSGGSIFILFVLMLLGIVLTIVLYFVMDRFSEPLSKVPVKTYIIISVIAVIVLTILTVIIFVSGLYVKILPQIILDRIATFDMTGSGRTIIYSDGFKALKDYWLLGGGGETWRDVYTKYQSYNYVSAQAHNLLLQIWLETGIIGALSYISIAVLVFFYVIKRKDDNKKSYMVILLTISLYIFGHSCLDFDFIYVSIPVIFFSGLGLFNGLVIETKKNNDRYQRLAKSVITVVCLIIVFFSITFIFARQNATKASDIMSKNVTEGNTESEISEAMRYLQKAIDLNPWNTKFYSLAGNNDNHLRIDLEGLYEAKMQIYPNDSQVASQRYAVLLKAFELQPKNFRINLIYGMFLLTYTDQEEQGFECLERAVEYSYMIPETYTSVAGTYMVIADYFEQQKENDKAVKCYKRVAQFEDEIEQIRKKSLREIEFEEQLYEYIELAQEKLK